MQPYIFDGSTPADVVINCTLCDAPPAFQGSHAEVSGYRIWDITKDGYTICDYDKQNNICYVKVRADKELKKIDIDFYDIRKHLNASDDCFAFNTLRDLFKIICLKHNGIVLHSSAIAYDGHGIAFSAHSGVGKSTHTGMWQKTLGDSVEIINDDTPAIMFNEGQPVMYGTPFSGTSGININKSVPLKAIVFLQRGEENKIEEIPVADAIRRFLEQVKRPPVAELMDETLGIIGKIIETVPVYLLTCTISEDAVNTVKNKLNI